MSDPKPTPAKADLGEPTRPKRGRMVRVSELIDEIKEIRGRFGETCFYVRDVSWGAVALNRQAEDDALKTQDADEERAARFVTSGYVRERLTLEFAAVRASTREEAAALLEEVRCRVWTPEECAMAIRRIDHPKTCSCWRWVDCRPKVGP